jgi:hypothetical protein
MALSTGLQPLLGSNVALNNLLRDVPGSRSKIAAYPERWQTTQHSVLLAEMMCRKPFALNNTCHRIGRPDTDPEVDVVELNRQSQNLPTLVGTCLLNKSLAVFGDSPTKDRFASLGAPDRVVDNKVDAVFISLIFHVAIGAYNDAIINSVFPERRLKPWKSPNRYRLI